MKIKAFVSCIVCLFYVTTSAQRMLNLNEGTISSVMEEPSATRTIIATDSGYLIKYDLNKVALLSDPIFKDCEIWQVKGFANNNVAGEPAYPYSSDSFVIPFNHDVRINVTNQKWISFDSKPSPARQPVLISDTVGYSIDNVIPILYNGKEWIPEQLVSDNGIRIYEDSHIVNIGITPVQYNVLTNEAKVCYEFEYEITFTPNSNSAGIKKSEVNSNFQKDLYLSNTTLNWSMENANSEDICSHSGMSCILDERGKTMISGINEVKSQKYLIISVKEYQDAIEDFADWKKTLGYDVAISYKDSWSSVDIMNEISNIDDLSYVLLVGNNEQVPGYRVPFNCILPVDYTYDNTPAIFPSVISDLPYGNMQDADHLIPNVSCGRIPVNNIAEAKNVLSKIESYENGSSASTKTYSDNFLFITKFLGNRNLAKMRNSQTTYEISDYMSKKSKVVCNMFEASDNENPQFWSDYGIDENGEFADPAPIPFKMQKPQYNWKVSLGDLINELNKGYSHVFYFAHGNTDCWVSPRINSSVASNLTNKNLSIIYSMACQTGDFSKQGSLLECFMTSENGGSVAAFGFTESTYIAYTDVIAISLFNGMYPSPGISSLINDRIDRFSLTPTSSPTEEITELGLLHKLAITKIIDSFPNTNSSNKYKNYQSHIFTLFGDPSMKISLGNEKSKSSNLSVDENGNYKIFNNGKKGIISVYDIKNDKVINFSGEVNISKDVDLSNYRISVQDYNSFPYVISESDMESMRLGSQNSTSDNTTVREGQIWKYYSAVNGNMDPSLDIYLNLCFSGTTEIDGAVYSNCYVWKEGEGFSEKSASLIAYMREEQGKVYARYIPGAAEEALGNGIDIIPYAPMMSILKDDVVNLSKYDVLLWDSSLGVGDLLSSTDDPFTSDVYEVKEINEFQSCGYNYKDYFFRGDWESYSFANGLGDLSSLLPIPGAFPISYGVDNWHLIQLVSNDGQVLFDASQVGSGINDSNDDNSIIKEKYYTLSGMEISKPDIHGIYVKVKEFTTGKVSTEKYLVK